MTQATKQTRAVLYARTSKADKTDRLESQLDTARAHCQKKNYHIVCELAEDDQGASGIAIDLPQLETARDLARQGRYDVLVVRDLDRLSRSLVKQLIVEEELRRSKVKVEYVLADFDDTPEGQLQKHIRATVAEFERAKIQERTSRGIYAALSRGSLVCAGKAPYGYQITLDGQGSRVFVLDPAEAQIIRLIFHWFVQDKIPAYQIARRLTERRVQTWSDNPDRPNIRPKLAEVGCWSTAVVLRIIKNRTYVGEWTYGKRTTNPITVSVPPIVDEQVFNLAQAQARRNKNRSTGRSVNALLVRRLYCGQCGYKIQLRKGSNAKRHAYYICPSVNRDSVRTCELPQFRVDLVDQAVWRWVEHLLHNSPHVLEQAADLYKTPPVPLVTRLQTLDALLSNKQDAWRNLLDTITYTSGRAKAVLGSDLQALEDTIDQLEVEKREVQLKLEDFGSTANNLRMLGLAIQEWRDDLFELRHMFPGRRRVVEMLDIIGTLQLVDQGKHIDLDHRLVSLKPPNRLPLIPSSFDEQMPGDCSNESSSTQVGEVITETLSIRLRLGTNQTCDYVIRPFAARH